MVSIDMCLVQEGFCEEYCPPLSVVLWHTGSHVRDMQQQKRNQVGQPSKGWKLEKNYLFSDWKRES